MRKAEGFKQNLRGAKEYSVDVTVEGSRRIIEWENIKIHGIGSIEKCVGEFNIAETLKTPYGKFKVKVYERQNGGYIYKSKFIILTIKLKLY
ncbi:hypothetical protein CF065_07930 [Clostridium sporogenes]|uniref:hypothetical protein n=1 Tax=Clostridium sporogenes TaxID=1509 RepID=UPI0013D321EE|nr:hypothetical protein [Clostridium sporogenes]MCW6076130.1 hypothetical protein [Clostridium sporogenes]MCW6111060.1 hypothetical protein [Clostridium sporogenes]NFP90973.1 hypothetical protein [Clostridium sporogenes]